MTFLDVNFTNLFSADNRSKRKRTADRRQDFTVFAEKRDQTKIRISPQLTLAAFQYLSTSKFFSKVIKSIQYFKYLKREMFLIKFTRHLTVQKINSMTFLIIFNLIS